MKSTRLAAVISVPLFVFVVWGIALHALHPQPLTDLAADVVLPKAGELPQDIQGAVRLAYLKPEHIEHARKALRDDLFIVYPKFKPFHFPGGKIDWDPDAHQTYNLYLHALSIVQYLCYGYENEHEIKYLHLAIDILNQWIGYSAILDPSREGGSNKYLW